MLFKLIGKGAHVELGVRYAQGDKIESKNPLDKLFRNKFKRIDGELGDVPETPDIPTPNIPTPDRDGEVETKTSPSKSGKKKNPHGERVRNVFKRTKANGVRVYVKSGWYTVTDKSDNSALNDKKLREDDVQEFIDSLEDEDD